MKWSIDEMKSILQYILQYILQNQKWNPFYNSLPENVLSLLINIAGPFGLHIIVL